MKKILLGSMALVAIALSSCKNDGTPSVKLNNELDTVSYLVGVDIANSLKSFPGEKLNEKAVMMGFAEKVKEMEPSCLMTDEEMGEYVRKYVEKAQKAQFEKELDSLKTISSEFMSGKKADGSYQETASGILYKVEREGNGAKPAATDRVRVHYEGKLSDGSVFDSSYQRGEPAEFALNQVIPGWTEGLQLMSEGSIYELVIPYQLAYGERGMRGAIPPCSDLTFKVELIKVLK